MDIPESLLSYILIYKDCIPSGLLGYLRSWRCSTARFTTKRAGCEL
jgi:hypothetical protein